MLGSHLLEHLATYPSGHVCVLSVHVIVAQGSAEGSVVVVIEPEVPVPIVVVPEVVVEVPEAGVAGEVVVVVAEEGVVVVVEEGSEAPMPESMHS